MRGKLAGFHGNEALCATFQRENPRDKDRSGAV